MYWDVNNLYGHVMQQKLPVNGFKWRRDIFKFSEELKQEYDEDSNKGYILKGDVCYVYKGNIRGTKLFFVLAQRMKIDKRQKHVFNLYDNKIYVIHIRVLRITHSIMS